MICPTLVGAVDGSIHRWPLSSEWTLPLRHRNHFSLMLREDHPAQFRFLVPPSTSGIAPGEVVSYDLGFGLHQQPNLFLVLLRMSGDGYCRRKVKLDYWEWVGNSNDMTWFPLPPLSSMLLPTLPGTVAVYFLFHMCQH